mgnify:CR=1 FL=1
MLFRSKTAEDKKYATDTRKFRDAVLTDGIHTSFTDSPVTDKLLMKDVCYRGQGFIGQHGKETKTSWDTLSYTLIQSHNVYQHIYAVQEGNRRYEQGITPAMVQHKATGIKFKDIIDEIFSKKTREESIAVIKYYESYWKQMSSGSQGFSGKKTVNARTMFNMHFEESDSDDEMANVIEQQDLEPVRTKAKVSEEVLNNLFTFG